MSKDFSKYQHIIQKLKGTVGKAGFDSKFASLTKALSKTEKFLLKMELNRLASPCTRLIDLRGFVDGECRLYEHGGLSHFLDDVAITVFEEQVNYYGSYSMGVYDAVKNTENNFRVLYKNEKSKLDGALAEAKPLEKLQYPARLHNLGSYFNRCEERMNFVIQLEVVLADKTKVNSNSIDLSVNGCRFRFNDEQKLKLGQKVDVRFIGLEHEFNFGDNNYFNYTVKNIQLDGNTQIVGCHCTFSHTRDSFKAFLKGYIQGNKRRYKINLDNSISALKARSFEQFVLPKVSELPIFFEQTKQGLFPSYILTSNNNQSLHQYWQDEEGHSTVNYLINDARIELMKDLARTGRTLLVYSFIHLNKSKCFFYTADTKQLSDDKVFRKKFLAFIADKPTFMVTELSYHEVDASKGFSPLTVANSLKVKDQHLNQPLSKEVKNILKNTPFVIVAKDVTTPSMIDDYKQLSFSGIEMERVKLLGHRRKSKHRRILELGINYKNHRHEERFVYETEAIIQCERVEWKGKSLDFSVSGLKVELDKTSVLVVGDIVRVTFPSLQKITSSFDLSGLPYEVVQINKKKTLINLRVHIKKHQHIGRSFFRLLIEKNQNKLTPDSYAVTALGLTEALRSIYASIINTPNLIIQASGSRYKLEAIACSVDRSSFLDFLRNLSDRKGFYNLYPLLHNLNVADLFSESLKKMRLGDLPTEDLLYISVKENEERIDNIINSRLASEFKSQEQRSFFINNTLKKGSFFAIKLSISRTDQPVMEHLNPELNYISSYAIHRGKQIEQEIWSVAGVIQLFDVTQEVLFRHKLIS